MTSRIILPGSEIHKLRHLNMLLSKDNKRLCDLLNSIKEDIALMNDIEDKYSDLRKENEDLKQKLETLIHG